LRVHLDARREEVLRREADVDRAQFLGCLLREERDGGERDGERDLSP
jgi:hypothetical protein